MAVVTLGRSQRHAVGLVLVHRGCHRSGLAALCTSVRLRAHIASVWMRSGAACRGAAPTRATTGPQDRHSRHRLGLAPPPWWRGWVCAPRHADDEVQPGRGDVRMRPRRGAEVQPGPTEGEAMCA